jgi:hypothetical protein
LFVKTSLRDIILVHSKTTLSVMKRLPSGYEETSLWLVETSLSVVESGLSVVETSLWLVETSLW